MTTATYTRNSNTTGMKVMTWQSVQKIAQEMGVFYYNEDNQYRRNGYGIKATPKNYGFGDLTRIEIITDSPSVRDNDYINHAIGRMAAQNFMLKLELWALKNNVKYLVTESSHRSYIQIIEG
jgi:hypothetical protein